MLYPTLTGSRNVIDLGGVWNFWLVEGENFDGASAGRPMEHPMTMAVPAAYNDLKEGVDFREHYGWVCYQRNLAVPAVLLTQRLVLRCAAIAHKCEIYIGGKLVCKHKGGFLPFEVEVNQFVQPGDNLLTIAVDNRIDHSTLPVGNENGASLLDKKGTTDDLPAGKRRNNPNFDFFNYAGILRPVKLYTTPKDYIADITAVSTVAGADARIQYRVDTVGRGDVRIEAVDEGGNVVATANGAEGVLHIPNVRLWQPMDAYLYQLNVTFGEDSYSLPYGVRTVEVRGTEFLINGRPFYFKGYGRHEDTFPNGRGINEAMNVKDVSLMKWMGANSFRTSHYPYSEEMMRLCDREGFVIIDEVPAVGLNLAFGGGANFIEGETPATFSLLRTGEHHRDMIRDMIARDKNHACVVMWSIANEADATSDDSYDYFKPLFDLARKLDPQKRPCTMVSVLNEKYKQDCTIRLSDVFCLNRYYGWYDVGSDLEASREGLVRELDFWATLGKPVMMTEYGADTVLGLHDTTPTMFSEEYQVAYYKMYSQVFDQYPCFVGEQVWNFADFATAESIMRVSGNKKGIFSRDRKPKLAAYYLKQRWESIPNFRR